MSSGKNWKIEKRQVSYLTTVHFGRWLNSQDTATREVPAVIPT